MIRDERKQRKQRTLTAREGRKKAKLTERGRPRKQTNPRRDNTAIAEHRAKNERKVQLETFRRKLKDVPGAGNFNDPRVCGGIDWSSIEFTHPSYKHIKQKHQYNAEMNVNLQHVTGNKRRRASASSSTSANGTVAPDTTGTADAHERGCKRCRRGRDNCSKRGMSGHLPLSGGGATSESETNTAPAAAAAARNNTLLPPHLKLLPFVVQLTPTVEMSERAKEQLEIEYLASGGLGDLKLGHLMIRRYIAENSAEVIVAHADRVAKRAADSVLQQFQSSAAELLKGGEGEQEDNDEDSDEEEEEVVEDEF